MPKVRTGPDPERAREMFSYAASYFGNADAQYELARLYLKNASSVRGTGNAKTPAHRARDDEALRSAEQRPAAEQDCGG